MKKIFFLIAFLFSVAHGESQVGTKGENRISYKSVIFKSELYKKYLHRGGLDPKIIKKCYFEGASPEEVNLALRDLRKFIFEFIKNTLIKNKKEIDDSFLINILNIYGHIIIYLEKARVDLTTKKVFKQKRRFGNTERPNSQLLFSYWAEMERKNGTKLHWNKFYARGIDYLIVLIRNYLMSPCESQKELSEMQDPWMYWLVERLGARISNNSKFGGYYNDDILRIKEIFKIWEKEFEKKHSGNSKIRRRLRRGAANAY